GEARTPSVRSQAGATGGEGKFLAVGCKCKTAVLSRFSSRFSDASLDVNVDDFSEIIYER
ncbi:MAG: hypothetical protein ACKOAH_23180, partial [Pirellula sp.]